MIWDSLPICLNDILSHWQPTELVCFLTNERDSFQDLLRYREITTEYDMTPTNIGKLLEFQPDALPPEVTWHVLVTDFFSAPLDFFWKMIVLLESIEYGKTYNNVLFKQNIS